MNRRQRSKARRSHKMRREQGRAALREQKARIVADLRARGLTHDPRFLVSRYSVSYVERPPKFTHRAGWLPTISSVGVSEIRARRTQ